LPPALPRPTRSPLSLTLPVLAALGLAAVGMAGCAPAPDGPRLLSPDEIAQAGQGSARQPDVSNLTARAARLSARAEVLRRTSIDQHEGRRLQDRAQRLAAL